MMNKKMPLYSVPTSSELNYTWSTLHRVPRRTEIPLTIKPWLSETGSLTTKLQNLGELTVEVLFDNWSKASTEEQMKLCLHPRERVHVRKVILSLNGTPVIYARSIIPSTSLKGHWRHLTKLGTQPLGRFLYKSNKVSRGKIEIAQLPTTFFPNINQPLWARRSIFYQYGHGILVSEAFSPTITSFLK